MRSFFKKLTSPFSSWKSLLGQKIRSLFRNPENLSFSALEQAFYEADLGPAMAKELVEKLRLHAKKDGEVLPFLKEELSRYFPASSPIELASPHVVLVVGANGSGKTTTLAKLAWHYHQQGKKVLLVAADTFRAAAVEQLETWARLVGVSLIKSQPQSDPAAVVFDALTAAKARGIDLVLIDTAGRLQTKTSLMQELEKIRRICQKQIDKAPHETLLVLDATIGQNALDQARTFHQHTPLTGIILTKLDTAAKGGIAVAIAKEIKVPIRWVGFGEKEEDFAPFDVSSFLDALLGINP